MKRLFCRLFGHRWKDVRVIGSVDFKGTDQHGNIGYVVKSAEWQSRCARCATPLLPPSGEMTDSSFGFKP